MEYAIPFNPSEDQLIQACIEKQQWAQQKVYEDHYQTMMGVCMRYSNSRDDAYDILHEGFLKVFQNMQSYVPGTLLGAWIRRIMVNTAIDFYRRESRRVTQDLDQAKSLSYHSTHPVTSMTVEEVMKAVQKLSPIYRSVFNLYVIEGYSHKEIADTLGITESTSRSNLVKARTKLKDLLHGLGE
jgi:RNA polymerase sigma factor (sigma-70 family)